jgi:para-aminobenzoate synthetase component 1
MTPVLQEYCGPARPETLAEVLRYERGLVLLHSRVVDGDRGRFSFIAARPFLTFRAKGSRCELETADGKRCIYGDPWEVLDGLVARYELSYEIDVPFPLGGAFGYCGYELRRSGDGQGVERTAGDHASAESRRSARLSAQRSVCSMSRAVDDLELPDCCFGFFGSLVVFDHALGKTWIVSTGTALDGSRQDALAAEEFEWWDHSLRNADAADLCPLSPTTWPDDAVRPIQSTLTRADFVRKVERVQEYIRAGDIYQVNLSQRFTVPWNEDAWALYQRLGAISPAPSAAYVNCGDFQLASASPELFLRLSGRRILTRPIKGTRPRSSDAVQDARLAYELQTSPKELAELLMITDLLRNDLGKVAEYGSVRVPELVRLESYAQVHHLVATIEGRLRPDVSHARALASSFPGGSITGAPKIRAMQIIDELEPVTRGPYTGALGYLGFNDESQFSILIRTAIASNGAAHFHSGAGIVADSVPEAEYEETLAKASAFFRAVRHELTTSSRTCSHT